MNKILKILIISDVFIIGGFGLVAPILSIFINDNLIGGSIASAGIASTIFLLTHAILQLAFSNIFNPKDRYWMLMLGTTMIAAVPFFYLFSTHIWHIFLAQFVYGVGAGFAYPTWSSFFTSQLDRGQRGYQWSINSSSVSLASALTAAIGAILAEIIGFRMVFLITGVISVFGLLVLLLIDRKQILKKT